MNIVNLCCHAKGYYSRKIYEENIFIPESLYDQLEDAIGEMDLCIPDLDGKHSETEANIDVDLFTEEEISKWDSTDIEVRKDNEYLYLALREICENLGIDNLASQIKEANDYLKSHVRQVCVVRYKIPSQHKELLDKVAAYLNRLPDQDVLEHRLATEKERIGLEEFIERISRPTGINFFEEVLK